MTKQYAELIVFLSGELTPAERKNMLIRYYSTRKRIWKAAHGREVSPGELKYLQDLAAVRGRDFYNQAMSDDLFLKDLVEADERLRQLKEQEERVAKRKKVLLRKKKAA